MGMKTRHIKKGDMVMVIAGKEVGKSGKVLKILNKKDRVLVEKINMIKRHMRPNRQYPHGGIIEKEASIHISNVMPICQKCTKPTRVGRKMLEDGRKVRVCRKCGEILDRES
jgi:large subunit ribosomal protein L24